MKKLIIMLEALTITTTAVPAIVACNQTQKMGLDLESLNSNSFKKLDTIVEKPSNGKLQPIYTRYENKIIETKNINDINDDQILINAIKDHIKVMTLKKLFGLNKFTSNNDEDQKKLSAFLTFWNVGVLYSSCQTFLSIDVKVIESNKKYEVTIMKEDLRSIQLMEKDLLEIISSAYNSIKGKQVQITITK